MSPITARVSAFLEPVLTGLPVLRDGEPGVEGAVLRSGGVHAAVASVAQRARRRGVVGRDTGDSWKRREQLR
jgi:hypothetical protein